MGILRTTLWTIGAMVAVGTIVDRANRVHRHRLVQTTLDLKPVTGAKAWQ